MFLISKNLAMCLSTNFFLLINIIYCCLLRLRLMPMIINMYAFVLDLFL
ncbi:hypothetical protein M0802_014413 [Mischocyttarus mexicanus]|nr:hypothetical protein M0802_014413 [Mischocyttarus mexicanus]